MNPREPEPMDATAASTLFAWLNREIWLVTASAGGRRSGLIATFVSQASIVADQPRVLVGLAQQHFTCELVQASRSFALHLLGEANIELVWRFGLQSGRDGDKFTGLAVQQREGCAPVLQEVIGWMECWVEDALDCGDRLVFLGEVRSGQVTNFAPPLTVKRVMELAPPHLLAELKRQRHLDSHRDAEVIRTWREQRGA